MQYQSCQLDEVLAFSSILWPACYLQRILLCHYGSATGVQDHLMQLFAGSSDSLIQGCDVVLTVPAIQSQVQHVISQETGIRQQSSRHVRRCGSVDLVVMKADCQQVQEPSGGQLQGMCSILQPSLRQPQGWAFRHDFVSKQSSSGPSPQVQLPSNASHSHDGVAVALQPAPDRMRGWTTGCPELFLPIVPGILLTLLIFHW